MAKNDNQNDVEDYLAQVEWENQQSQRRIPLPWYMEPKWKSKKVNYSINNSINNSVYRFSPFIKFILAIFVGVIGVFLYKVEPVLLFSLLGLSVFILFMIRDAKRKSKD